MAAETSSQASKIGPPSPTQNSASGTRNFASGKLDSTPSAADGLSAFFQLKPVPYVEGENASKSKSTRPPKFFDLHLHEPLQLKTVVVSEELTQRFSSICDQKVLALDAKVIKAPGSALAIFPELTNVEEISQEVVRDIKSETSIVEDYWRRTAEVCHEVASKLLFGLKQPDVLFWEKTERTAEQALPDGYLTLQREPTSLLCQEQTASLNSLQTHHLHRLTLFEFKSLKAGSLQKMTDIVNSAGEFSWMTCGSTDYANRVHDCDAATRHATHGIFSVTGRKTGYDATQEWWVKPPPVQLGKRRSGSTPDSDPEVEISSTVALASKTGTVTTLSLSAQARSIEKGGELLSIPRLEEKREVPHEANEEQVVADCAFEQIQSPAGMETHILPPVHGDSSGEPKGVPDRDQDTLKQDIPDGKRQTGSVHARDILQQVILLD